jgi:Flp pilus assembly protein TadD
LYLSGELADAALELQTAQRLGAPGWRVAYHLGLVDEAAGRLDAAREHYAAAVAGNPGWLPARSRLNALQASSSTR